MAIILEKTTTITNVMLTPHIECVHVVEYIHLCIEYIPSDGVNGISNKNDTHKKKYKIIMVFSLPNHPIQRQVSVCYCSSCSLPLAGDAASLPYRYLSIQFTLARHVLSKRKQRTPPKTIRSSNSDEILIEYITKFVIFVFLFAFNVAV